MEYSCPGCGRRVCEVELNLVLFNLSEFVCPTCNEFLFSEFKLVDKYKVRASWYLGDYDDEINGVSAGPYTKSILDIAVNYPGDD